MPNRYTLRYRLCPGATGYAMLHATLRRYMLPRGATGYAPALPATLQAMPRRYTLQAMPWRYRLHYATRYAALLQAMLRRYTLRYRLCPGATRYAPTQYDALGGIFERENPSITIQ